MNNTAPKRKKIFLKKSFIYLMISLLVLIPSYIRTNAFNFLQLSPFAPNNSNSSLSVTPYPYINFSSTIFPTGNFPFSVAIGDMDGDGLPDLVVANSNSYTVSVLRNTSTSGNVSFATQQSFSTGITPVSIAIGDIDGDGLPDLAIANLNDSTVSVLRNTSTSGNVSFATQVTFSTGRNPFSVAIGDIDGDGLPDLAVANFSANTVSVLRNTSTRGNVSFATEQSFLSGSEPHSVVIGDIDGDGKLDLAIANDLSNTVAVLRNISTVGVVSFATRQTFSTDTTPQSVAIGDIDGDGKLDLATANGGSSTVSVLKNTSTSGNVSFAAQQSFSTGSGSFSVAMGDLNADGLPDLAITNTNDNTVSILKNTSNSSSISFATQENFFTGNLPFSVAMGDMDGDGLPDLAIANTNDNTALVLRSLCTSQPTTTTMASSSANPSVFGQSITITATVSPVLPAASVPTGSIIFNIDGTTQSPINLFNGQASFSSSSLSVGSHHINATYSGDSIFAASSSTIFSQTVNKATTSTTVNSSISPAVFGQMVTFTAIVSALNPSTGTPSGVVQFKDGSNNLGTPVNLSGGQAQLSTNSFSVGTHFITAVYNGDSNFNTSTSNTFSQTVNKANTLTDLIVNPTQIVFGQMVTFTAIVFPLSPTGVTPSGVITFKDGNNSLGSPSLSNGQAILTVPINSVGVRTITAIYSGDNNFNSSTSNIVNLLSSALDHNAIYVADTLNNRIQRSTNNGQSWQTVGNGAGVGLGQFNAPKGVATNFASSLIFVADTGNNRIQRSTDGGITWSVIATPGTTVNQVNQPSGVAYDEVNNKLYIADTTNSRILVVSNASTTTPSFAVFAGAMVGTTVGKVNQPQSVAVDINGKVYVADTLNNRIQMNNNGLSTGWIVLANPGTALGQVNTPKGVYVDNSGRVWVAENANNRIQVNTNGVWSVFMNTGTAVGTVNRPEGVVVNLSGSVFIADTGNNRIQSKPANGGNATVVGPPGLSVGQFNQPAGIR